MIIKQIIPAELGWWVRINIDGDKSDAAYDRVVVWVLGENGDEDCKIFGMIADGKELAYAFTAKDTGGYLFIQPPGIPRED